MATSTMTGVIRPYAPTRSRALAAVVLSIVWVASAGALVGAQDGSAASEASDGVIVTAGVGTIFESLDGQERISLVIDEFIDPFSDGLADIDRDRLAAEGVRFVGIRLRLENLATSPLPFLPVNAIRLLFDGSVLIGPSFIVRDLEARQADPEIPAGAVEPGETRAGLIFYSLPADASIDAVVFFPTVDRLVTLAGDLTGGEPAIVAASGGSTEASVAIDPEPAGPPEQAEAPDGPPAGAPVDPDNAPDPPVDVGAVVLAGAYQDARYGYSASWDPALWEIVELGSGPDPGRLVLTSDVFTVEIEGRADPDLVRCVSDRVHADLDVVSGFDAIADVEAPTSTGRTALDAGIYRISVPGGDDAERLVRYVECRELTTTSGALRIVATAPERFWEIDRLIATELLDTILPPRVDLPAAGGDADERSNDDVPVESA